MGNVEDNTKVRPDKSDRKSKNGLEDTSMKVAPDCATVGGMGEDVLRATLSDLDPDDDERSTSSSFGLSFSEQEDGNEDVLKSKGNGVGQNIPENTDASPSLGEADPLPDDDATIQQTGYSNANTNDSTVLLSGASRNPSTSTGAAVTISDSSATSGQSTDSNGNNDGDTVFPSNEAKGEPDVVNGSRQTKTPSTDAVSVIIAAALPNDSAREKTILANDPRPRTEKVSTEGLSVLTLPSDVANPLIKPRKQLTAFNQMQGRVIMCEQQYTAAVKPADNHMIPIFNMNRKRKADLDEWFANQQKIIELGETNKQEDTEQLASLKDLVKGMNQKVASKKRAMKKNDNKLKKNKELSVAIADWRKQTETEGISIAKEMHAIEGQIDSSMDDLTCSIIAVGVNLSERIKFQNDQETKIQSAINAEAERTRLYDAKMQRLENENKQKS